MRYIHDPINGAIPLTNEEFEIVNTRTLRRLQHIRQLEFISLVFPSCNHTRFEHTLGVTYLLKKASENRQLIDSFIKPILWNSPVNLQDLLNVAIPEKKKTAFIKSLFSLSGLIHDIGHGPFSHFSETIFELIGFPSPKLPKYSKFEFIDVSEPVKLHEWIMFGILTFDTPCENNYKKLQQFLNESLKVTIEDDDVLKECCRFFERRYNEIAPAIKRVAQVFKLPDEADYSQFRRLIAYSACGKIPGIKSLIYGVFDVDRLDYMRRDSFMAGVKYGDIELNRLLGTSLTFSEIKNEKKEILIDYAKGIAALENMYVGKDLLYFTTIYHPCSATARSMLLKFILDLPEVETIKAIDSKTKKMEQTLTYMIKIFSMEDYDCICYLKKRAEELKKPTSQYVSMLINRDLYKKVAVYHWDEIHPSLRDQIRVTAKNGYDKIWELAQSYEKQLGIEVLKVLSGSTIKTFKKKYGDPIIINLPPYTEKWPDIRNVKVKRKSMYDRYSFHRANEVSPILDVSYKTAARNCIISVYLNPILKPKFDKKKPKILEIISNAFSCHPSNEESP